MGGSTHNGHILTESRRALSPSPACPIFLSLYIHILSPPWFYVLNMYLFHNFTYSPPRFFAPSLTHRTCQPYNPLRSLLQRVFLRSPSAVLPTLRPATFSIHTITVLTTLFIHSLSQTHAPSHLFSLPSLPHQPLIPYINRTEIPIPVINMNSFP